MALDHQDMSKLIETGIVAARLAGQQAMEEMKYIKTSVKEGNEIVTQADPRCQKIIIDRIKEIYPDHGFIGEEGSEGKIFKQPPRGDEDIWWIIDPIDGTNNFAHKLPIFTVSIGAMYKNEVVAGIIFDPTTDQMYTACKDGEAQLNGSRIKISDEPMNMFTSVALNSSFKGALPEWAQHIILNSRFRNLGSLALELAYQACGGLVAVVAGTIKLWDIAAGILIAERAGAVATDYQGNKIFPLDPRQYDGSRFDIIVANKKVHAELLTLIQNSV
jgi:myo-inositol-1(or 4)-monophosphatase